MVHPATLVSARAFKSTSFNLLARALGHRDINTTLLYTQLVQFESDEFHSAVAKTIDEAKGLVESGFGYVTDIDGIKLFRKRK